MIETLTLKNFQSHRDTTIKLGKMTVLVGPSSSGKSAIVRAVKALTSNPTAKGYITAGESTMQISATTDKGTLTLTKGKPEDSYVILANSDIENPRRYTKLGGTVPDDVTNFLGIDSKDALNYAGQFDMPYLLKSSPAEVARTLGELTNVSAIFEASREGSRKRNAAASVLKMREGDLEGLLPALNAIEGLEERTANQEAAEASYSAAVRLLDRREALNALLTRLATAQSVLKAHIDSPALPDTSRAELLLNKKQTLESLLAKLSGASFDMRKSAEALLQAQEHIDKLTIQHDLILQEAGICPTCHQSTKELTHAH